MKNCQVDFGIHKTSAQQQYWEKTHIVTLYVVVSSSSIKDQKIKLHDTWILGKIVVYATNIEREVSQLCYLKRGHIEGVEKCWVNEWK